MAENDPSKTRAPLALAMGLVGLLSVGCAGKDVKIDGNGRPIAPEAKPTPLTYEGARTHLLDCLDLKMKDNLANGLYDVVNDDGYPITSNAGNQKGLTIRVDPIDGNPPDSGMIVVATAADEGYSERAAGRETRIPKSRLQVKVSPLPGFDYIDFCGIKFTGLEFENENVGRGDIVDRIKFEIADTYFGKKFPTDHKPAMIYYLPAEEKAFATVLARFALGAALESRK